MKIRINSIKFSNIRAFKNIGINFSDNITVIMMPNGTGKTTTIELMTAALIGEISPREIASFRPHYGNSRTGYFLMKVLLDDFKYTIKIDFDFSRYKAIFTYTDTLTGIESNRPIGFRKVFTKYFVEKFIFDGEIPTKFMSPDSKYTEESIMSLYNLEKLSSLQSNITRIKSLLINEKSTTKAEHESGLSRTSNEIDQLVTIKMKLINDLKNHKINLKANIDEINDKNKEITQILSEDQNLTDEIEQFRKNIFTLKHEVAGIDTKISKALKYVHNLTKRTWAENTGLIDILVSMKLPSSLSEQFFIDLIDSGTKCICGRDFDIESKSYLELHYKLHLEENNIGILNEIKSYSRSQNYTDIISTSKKELAAKMDRIAEHQNKIDRLQLSGDIDRSVLIRDLNREIGSLEMKNNTIKKMISMIENTSNKDINNSIPAIEQQIKNLTEKLNEIRYNKLVNENQKLLRNIIDTFQINILSKIKNDLVKCSNIKLKKIIDNDNIEIQSIDKYIKISNRDGVSVGQSLSVAYSFISTLFERSNFDIPFVIDSPAGSLDNSFRREVARILPKAFNQLVLFVISSEKQSFIAEFESNSSLNIKYMTIFKKDDEIMVNENKEFFDQFQEKVSINV